MSQKLSFYLINELGKRANQEDTIYPPLSAHGFVEGLFILCDGMGGHASGEVASQLVCDTMSKVIAEDSLGAEVFTAECFNRALSAAYDALDAHDAEPEKKMGTTLSFAKFHSGGCFIAHIGDSRIYHIRPSEHRILFVTKDHSLINDLVELGEMTPEEARVSNRKNVITRAMQPHQDHRAKADMLNITDLETGDYIFMCSDGMLERMDDGQLLEILTGSAADEKKVQSLKEATQNNQDNHSAILIHLLPESRKRVNYGSPKALKRIMTIIAVCAVLLAALSILLKLI